ncbi:TPA: hypothetical protein ACHX5W_003877 [Salmonella enterica]
MIRVAYETRDTDGTRINVIRRVELVPQHELNIADSSLRGTPVKILNLTRRSFHHSKTSPAIRSSKRKSYADLKRRLSRHFRRSAWKALVEVLVDEHLIQRLEWEEVLREAGYPTKPFSYHWHHFKKQFHDALQVSPNTRNMIHRLEKMDWLLPYLEED